MRAARFAGIPSWGHGHTSSARMDVQASEEKALNSLLISQSRPSLLGGLGGLANVTLTSYETLVIDNERFGALRRILRGVEIDEEHLAYDVIADMVNGQDVICHEQTLKYLRAKEVWYPRLAERRGLIDGQPVSKTMIERARERVTEIINGHTVEPLPDILTVEIEAIIEEYGKSVKKQRK